MQRDFDILIYGATGFTGRIVAKHLNQKYGSGNLTFALGGRNEKKLKDVRRSQGISNKVQILVADSADPEAMRTMVSRARVVLTTVGPYATYGSELVAACAKAGTHYCDLTGEVQWMRRMIDTHQQTAQASGARIVHTCGFDSIPSDIGTWFVQKEMRKRHGVPASHVKYRAREFSGGFSGGTVASMMHMMDEAARDPSILQVINDPYALNSPAHRRGQDGPDRTTPEFDADLNAWIGPFVMASVNTRVVRRTNELLDFAYGRDFRYDEATVMRGGPLGFASALGLAAGTNMMNAMATLKPARDILKRLLPEPGEGPTQEAMDRGYFEIEVIGKHPTQPATQVRAHVKGDRDPGYGSTAKMLTECAVALAQDTLPVEGGFWTPASAMGDALLDRLPLNAGVTFEILD